ncbi:MAG: hypothetical protein LLG09_03350 [Negativicutes bacterium]|nr:hypothetical protein [Negativicutes bacterium]
MYLHLGHNKNAEINEIIGIFDLRTCHSALFQPLTLIEKKRKDKSYVLTRTELLASSIASHTLHKRCDDIHELLWEK